MNWHISTIGYRPASLAGMRGRRPALDGRDWHPAAGVHAAERVSSGMGFLLATLAPTPADGKLKLVRPMIRGTRFLATSLRLEEDRARKAAFRGRVKHKENRELWTLPVPNLNPQEPESPELYDLSSDPGEQCDVASEHPGRVRRMLASLEDWFDEVERDRKSIDGHDVKVRVLFSSIMVSRRCGATTRRAALRYSRPADSP